MKDAVSDFELSPAEARKYVHNCFTGNAKRFYDTDETVKVASTMEGVFECMKVRFMPSASKAAVTNMLDTLTIAKPLQTKTPREQ